MGIFNLRMTMATHTWKNALEGWYPPREEPDTKNRGAGGIEHIIQAPSQLTAFRAACIVVPAS